MKNPADKKHQYTREGQRHLGIMRQFEADLKKLKDSLISNAMKEIKTEAERLGLIKK